MITIATLSQASAQEVFNQVATHLITQNEKAMEGTTCVYLTPKGLKCAAGCLLSKDDFESLTKAERTNPWHTLVKLGHVPRTHSRLIVDLQQIHDTFNPPKWNDLLRFLATQKGFEIPPVLEVKT